MIDVLCNMVRAIQTNRERVGVLQRIVLTTLMLPPFSLLVLIVRVFGRSITRDVRTREGIALRCKLLDLIQLYLYVFRIWEPAVSDFIRRRLRQGDGFVDVGANIGYDALLARYLVGESGWVVAIEASPAIYQRLQDHLQLNGSPTNVRALNEAASDAPGDLKLYAGPSSNTGLTSTVQRDRLVEHATVRARPLGDMLTQDEIATARLIKIDVEGGEPSVIRGMLPMLQRCSPDAEILLELSPLWWEDQSATAQQVIEPLLDMGFHAYEFRNSYWPWHYLWPNDVSRPQRVRRQLTQRVKRIDLVLSKVDQDAL